MTPGGTPPASRPGLPETSAEAPRRIHLRLGSTAGLAAFALLLLVTGWCNSRDTLDQGQWITSLPRGDRQAIAEQIHHEAMDPIGHLELRDRLGPRMSARGRPVQENLPRSIPGWRRGAWTLTPRAAYGIEARVLALRSYRRDELAPVSPLDLALGWGRMRDEAVYGQLGVRISRRYYSYRWRGSPPIPLEEIAHSSANTHLVPASPEVARALDGVRRGDWVRLYGFLIDIEHPSGWVSRTSLVRTDTGAGACEILWVVAAEVVDGPSPMPHDD